jgi:hypothetical protein
MLQNRLRGHQRVLRQSDDRVAGYNITMLTPRGRTNPRKTHPSGPLHRWAICISTRQVYNKRFHQNIRTNVPVLGRVNARAARIVGEDAVGLYSILMLE